MAIYRQSRKQIDNALYEDDDDCGRCYVTDDDSPSACPLRRTLQFGIDVALRQDVACEQRNEQGAEWQSDPARQKVDKVEEDIAEQEWLR